MRINKLLLFILGFLVVLSTGCRTVKPQAEEIKVNEIIAAEEKEDSISWHRVFVDPMLTTLIDKALNHNADFLTASLNVEQAEASLKASRLLLMPAANIGAETGLSKAGSTSGKMTYNLPVSLQWEINLAGQHNNRRRAAIADYWSTLETRRAIKMQLITSVASHYYTLVMLDKQQKIMRQSIENARKTVEVMKDLKQYGLQSEAAVNQSKVELLKIESMCNTAEQQIKETENSIRLLIGENLDSIFRTNADSIVLPIDFNSSYPLEILASRPDVKAAEYALMSQIELVGVARAAFYPSLSISASAGWTNNLGDIINPGKILMNLLGSLVQPIFNRGQNKANLAIANAQQQQALVDFNQALLVAGNELQGTLMSCDLSNKRIGLRLQEIQAAQRAYDVSRIIMKNSSGTYLEVLTAQSAVLQSQLSLINDKLNLLQSQINLFKAVGGKL